MAKKKECGGEYLISIEFIQSFKSGKVDSAEFRFMTFKVG